MQSFINGQNIWVLIIAVLWTLPWKGYALWLSAKHNQKKWFIAIIIFNTFGLLEIFYIFFIQKKTPKQILNVIKSKI